MQVEAMAIADFVHGDIYGRRGKPVRKPDGSLLDESTARDLEHAGLLTIQVVDRRVDQVLTMRSTAEIIAGKVPAAGQDQPSSASRAARHLPQMAGTLHLPKRT